MKKKEAVEIARQYPESIRVAPREAFIDQLAEFIIKISDKLK